MHRWRAFIGITGLRAAKVFMLAASASTAGISAAPTTPMPSTSRSVAATFSAAGGTKRNRLQTQLCQ